MRTCAIIRRPRCLIDLVCLLMPITPEDRARENIDKLLTDAGLDRPGQARYQSVRPAEPWPCGSFRLKSGYGEADYLLFVDGTPIGVVEAKKKGHTLTGVEPVYPSDKRKQRRARSFHKL